MCPYRAVNKRRIPGTGQAGINPMLTEHAVGMAVSVLQLHSWYLNAPPGSCQRGACVHLCIQLLFVCPLSSRSWGVRGAVKYLLYRLHVLSGDVPHQREAPESSRAQTLGKWKCKQTCTSRSNTCVCWCVCAQGLWENTDTPSGSYMSHFYGISMGI